jgi:hypothetical protein
MAIFDEVLAKMNKEFRYEGNPPTNETEYNAMKDNITDAPTWTEIKSEMDNYVDPRVSAKAKLIAGEALTEDEANTIVL